MEPVSRDDYDREVKQAKEKQKKRYTPGPARPKKPDLQVYHPRQRATEKVHTAGALKDEPNDNGTQLFCLDFEADGGEVTSVIVYEDDDAEQLAAMISNQNQLEGGMREALKRRIQEEISKRRVQR
ncbi:hypothetical protein XENTR_v10009540 [Xenopus tropicalis]|nr:hypothetical protein XENTR_v10009540 [Xenopus tropicalis]